MKWRAERDHGAAQDFSSLRLDTLDRSALQELLLRASAIYSAQPVDDVKYRALVGKIVERMSELDRDEAMNQFAQTLQDLHTKKIP